MTTATAPEIRHDYVARLARNFSIWGSAIVRYAQIAVAQATARAIDNGTYALQQRCPVCEGRGFVPAGFYGIQEGTGSPACRRCDGLGTVSAATQASPGKDGA